MFFLGFDFGTKNIGIAVGQNITNTANIVSTIKAKNGIPNWESIKSIIHKWNPTTIIVGYPLNLNGTIQNITNQAELFAKIIQKKFNISTFLHDERLSTVEAKSLLFQKKGYKMLNSDHINAVSAVLILESWLSQR